MRIEQDRRPIIEIDSRNRWPRIEFGELWRNRAVVWVLIQRDTKVRYKQRVVGITWAALQPLSTMFVFTLLFNQLVPLPRGEAPYPLFALSALVPWTYFSHALTKATICLVDNAALLSKVYFPRLVFPLAAVLAALSDFIVSFVLLLGVLIVYGVAPRPAILALPFFLLLGVLAALGLGLWLSAITVQYRDVTNALPFMMQLALFLTPVAYATELIPARWRYVYSLNPLAVVIDGFRWSLLGPEYTPGGRVWISVVVVVVVLVTGLYFFRQREDRFADVV